MGLYIELPENWARFSLEVTDVHGHELEVKVIDTDLDLVRCRECKYYNGHEQYCEIDHFAREYGFCYSGKRRTDADPHIQCIEQEEWYDWRDEQEYEDRWGRNE